MGTEAKTYPTDIQAYFPQGKTRTGAKTLHTNRTKWPRELRHPNDIIRTKHECMEIPHKITQEDVGRTGRAHELRHSTRINRTEHAPLRNGYYYSVASTTGCYYVLRMATTTSAIRIVFHVGPAVGGSFFSVFHVGPKLGPT